MISCVGPNLLPLLQRRNTSSAMLLHLTASCRPPAGRAITNPLTGLCLAVDSDVRLTGGGREILP